MNSARPASFGRRDRHAPPAGLARQQFVDRLLDLPPARASRCNRRACRPAWSGRRRVRGAGAASAASAARSDGCLSQGTSGCRRIVPVEEHGASSSTASNGSAVHSFDIGADDLGVRRQPGEISTQALKPGRRAVDRGEARAGSGKLRGLAAGSGAQVGDAKPAHIAEQARRQAPPRRPAPTRRPRQSPEAASRRHGRRSAPSRSAAGGRQAWWPTFRGRSSL